MLAAWPWPRLEIKAWIELLSVIKTKKAYEDSRGKRRRIRARSKSQENSKGPRKTVHKKGRKKETSAGSRGWKILS